MPLTGQSVVVFSERPRTWTMELNNTSAWRRPLMARPCKEIALFRALRKLRSYGEASEVTMTESSSPPPTIRIA
jgi:hypothetical protein